MSIYLSASSIRDFMDCRRKYYYRINFKDESVPSREMILGRILHEILEKEWQDKEKALDLATKLSKEYNISAKDYKKVTSWVDTFFERFRDLLHEDDVVEKNFKLKYDKGVYIVGKIDRILPGPTVIDWKTSPRLPITLDNNPQFILYYAVIKELYGKYPSNVYHANLSQGKLKGFSPHRRYINLLYNNIIPDMISNIRRRVFIHDGLVRHPNVCKQCNFRRFCWDNLKNELDSSSLTN